MRQALFYEEIGHDKVQCQLCPNNCILSNNERGNCQVRKNVKGKLISENFGFSSSIQIDPIEKKPLYHFYPGSHILSLGSIGCNLNCDFSRIVKYLRRLLIRMLPGNTMTRQTW